MLYLSQTKSIKQKRPFVRLFVGQSVSMSCMHNSSLMAEQILMKHYTAALYFLRMVMNEDNPGQKYFKGHN